MNDYRNIAKIVRQWVDRYAPGAYGHDTIIGNVGIDTEGRWWSFNTRHTTLPSGLIQMSMPYNFQPCAPEPDHEG